MRLLPLRSVPVAAGNPALGLELRVFSRIPPLKPQRQWNRRFFVSAPAAPTEGARDHRRAAPRTFGSLMGLLEGLPAR